MLVWFLLRLCKIVASSLPGLTIMGLSLNYVIAAWLLDCWLLNLVSIFCRTGKCMVVYKIMKRQNWHNWQKVVKKMLDGIGPTTHKPFRTIDIISSKLPWTLSTIGYWVLFYKNGHV